MIQLSFDENFENIIEKPINYWKNIDDAPEKIKKFINKTSDSRIVFEEKTTKYYCSKCLKELDKNNICPKCLKKLINNDKYKLKIFDINEIKEFTTNSSYYVFDIIDDNVLIYIINEYVTYNNPLSLYPMKMSNLTIDKTYQVLSDKIVDLTTNKSYSYDTLDKILKDINDIMPYDWNINDNETFEVFETIPTNYVFLYPYNLTELEDTSLYQYSNIGSLQEYLSSNYFNLTSLTYSPIYCKQFEYLIKLKLYNLACNSAYLIDYHANFKKTFGVDKKYYSFMTEIDISHIELLALKLCPTTDIKMLNFITNNLDICKYLKDYVKLDKLRNYFLDQGLTDNNIHEYYDYIRCCQKLKFDLKDKNILYPKNFIEQHAKVTYQVISLTDENIDKNIKNLSELLNLNKYEDDKYVIFPAEDINSLINESKEQSNCVRTYSKLISNNECQIYFMRYKKDIIKSLITIEVKNNKVVQTKTKFNKEPNEEQQKIIKKWEKELVKINSYNEK